MLSHYSLRQKFCFKIFNFTISSKRAKSSDNWWGGELHLSEKSQETKGQSIQNSYVSAWPASANDREESCVYSHNKWIHCVSRVNLHFRFSSKWRREPVLAKHISKLSPCSRNSPQCFYGSAMFPCYEVTPHRPVAGEQHVNKDATGDVFICDRLNY